jgi:phosphopantothenoylcysteine synthetase/decarboxylase
MTTGHRTLYLVVSGAPTTEAETIPDLVRLLHQDRWHITVLSTPTGARFHDLDELEELTGEPVRVEFRHPGTGTSLPPADAVLACPLSFNSTNRVALGLTDTFATALVCEMIGHGVPTVIVPKTGVALAAHPAFDRNLALLSEIPAVQVLYSPGRKLPAWREIVDTLSAVTNP